MFESSRLSYRKLKEADFDFFYKLLSDQDVMKYAYLDIFDSKENAQEAFNKVLELQDDDHEGTQYIVLLKGQDTAPPKVIGIVDYEVVLKNAYGGIYEIGYFIQKAYWGNGFATEMAKALIDYLFNNDHVHKIVASCHGENSASESIMKKLGMSKEGIFKLARYKNGSWVDEIKYGILRQEWDDKLSIIESHLGGHYKFT